MRVTNWMMRHLATLRKSKVIVTPAVYPRLVEFLHFVGRT